MKNLLKKLKTKEDILIVTTLLGIILLSIGIGLIKPVPPFGAELIILGSFLLYVSVIGLVFVIK